MKGSGEYSERFEHLVCVRTTDTTTGDKPKTYTGGSFYWGGIAIDSATEQTEFGAVRPTTLGTITLRNYLNISALDRLRWVQYDQLFVIDGVRYGDNETICDVHELTGGT